MIGPMTIFGVDAASYQGRVDWAAEDTICDFGWEKVTEGTGYTNPYWADAKTQMTAREPDGFTGGGYLFLEAGNGAAQADHFAAVAGDMTGLGIGIDVEPTSGSNPVLADLTACATRLRSHYPGHPLTGYIPPWYWGNQDTAEVNVLWASRYVYGFGAPATLYARVPASYWAPYGGGRVPSLLQFSSSASVPGVAGVCDVSAFRDTPAEYRALVAGTVPPTPPPPPGPVPDWQAQMMNALPYLRQGSTGLAVRRAQALLDVAAAGLAVDGVFGPATAAATARVQAAHGLTADSVVGPLTWALLVTGAA